MQQFLISLIMQGYCKIHDENAGRNTVYQSFLRAFVKKDQ